MRIICILKFRGGGGSRSQDIKTKVVGQSEISGGGEGFKLRKPSVLGGDYGYYLEPHKEVYRIKWLELCLNM